MAKISIIIAAVIIINVIINILIIVIIMIVIIDVYIILLLLLIYFYLFLCFIWTVFCCLFAGSISCLLCSSCQNRLRWLCDHDSPMTFTKTTWVRLLSLSYVICSTEPPPDSSSLVKYNLRSSSSCNTWRGPRTSTERDETSHPAS